MTNRKTLNDKGKEYERLGLCDKVLYKGNYYTVNNACYVANDGTQVVDLIRVADIESNRVKRPSIRARADECKIIIESDISFRKENGKH